MNEIYFKNSRNNTGYIYLIDFVPDWRCGFFNVWSLLNLASNYTQHT